MKIRNEIVGTPANISEIGDIARPLGTWEKLYQVVWLRKVVVVLLLIIGWQWYALHLADELLVPTFTATVQAWYKAAVSGELFIKVGYSLKVLAWGYAAGILLATLLTIVATLTKVGQDIMETLTSMFSPLPAIALLPLALIWFGLGNGSLTFVLIHSVLWPVALSMHSGFKSVSPTLRMVGKNYGLTGMRYARHILFPAAFPSILTGAKIGWAFAWRTLIAAELVFGVASGSGGLGWFIAESKNNLDIPNVFAGLLTVIIIGLVVENLIFRPLEACTVKKWGMQS
jgi:NitT/TauT family transport system permease protein